MQRALIPWENEASRVGKEGKEVKKWKGDWQFAVEVNCGASHVLPANAE